MTGPYSPPPLYVMAIVHCHAFVFPSLVLLPFWVGSYQTTHLHRFSTAFFVGWTRGRLSDRVVPPRPSLND